MLPHIDSLLVVEKDSPETFDIIELLAGYITINLNNQIFLIEIKYDCLILISQKDWRLRGIFP